MINDKKKLLATNTRISMALVKTLIAVAMVSGVFVAPASFAVQPEVAVVTSSEMESIGVTRISINTADAETLARVLEGIGENKAEAIVAWRESNGEFKSLDELTQVEGIGQATLEKNLDRLSL